MSLTVAAVQVPYCHHPYQKGAFSDSSSSSSSSSPNINGALAKSAFQLPIDLSLATSAKPARWSQTSDYSEGKAEDQQMSNNGSPPRPLHDQTRENHAVRLSKPPTEHVLPPMISSGQDPIMDRQSRHSPSQLPNARLAEGADYALERRGPRLHGVHSILNPSHGDDEERRSRRRGASEMEEGQRATFTPPSVPVAPAGTTSGAGLSLAETSPPLPGGPRIVRRILTPISPRLHRAASYGRLPGTIDATERPFLSDFSRMATPEHASSSVISQLQSHTSQVAQHSPFIVPAAPTPPLIQPHRRASVSVVGSARPSPSPSFADSYSQSGMSGQTSPSMHPLPVAPPPGPTPPGSMRLTPSPNLRPMSTVPPGSLDNEQGFHGPVVSSGQNYQILTVDTSKGHMQLPVEVQAASRMADEKRKRNAGASARFRARRKEKEREAASKISNLELELAYAQEDSRHYKAERDYLADLMKYVPQYESHLKNRPPSPRHNRPHHVPRPALSSIDSPLSTVASERYDSPEMDRPVTRRRTEAYSIPNTAPQHQYPTSPYTPYPPSHTQLPPPQQHAPAQFAQSGTHPQGPPPPLLNRAPAPHEIHRPEQAYDRNWSSRPNEPQR